VIVPKDEAALLARQNPVKRLLMRANKGLAGYVVCIPENALPMTSEDLLGEIKHYRKLRRTGDRGEP
jgi:hypothetical protein